MDGETNDWVGTGEPVTMPGLENRVEDPSEGAEKLVDGDEKLVDGLEKTGAASRVPDPIAGAVPNEGAEIPPPPNDGTAAREPD